MPKLIDYPRTSYTGAWELSEVIDDTGGKCAIDTAARKLDRKVSGSFKAIIGSAVKFGLITSKRDLLTTTTLFKRIKHAYDKQEEIIFHREAFLTPPLFTQICRKFRSRELPVQMLDVMLIREFGVEEINAQGVAKAFVEGCRMVALLDEGNIIADIDALSASRPPRREVANIQPALTNFQPEGRLDTSVSEGKINEQPPGENSQRTHPIHPIMEAPLTVQSEKKIKTPDAIANLFGISEIDDTTQQPTIKTEQSKKRNEEDEEENHSKFSRNSSPQETQSQVFVPNPPTVPTAYQIQVSGPGISTNLSIVDEEDIAIAFALLEKIRRQLRA